MISTRPRIVFCTAVAFGGLWSAWRVWESRAPSRVIAPVVAHPQESNALLASRVGAEESAGRPRAGSADLFPQAMAPATPPGNGVVGEFTLGHGLPLREAARAWAESKGAAPVRLALPLTESRDGTMIVRSYRETEPDAGVFTGELEDRPGTTVVLSHVGDAQAGVVLIPDEARAFNFRAGDDGVLRITELDTRLAPGCGEPVGRPLTPPDAPGG